MLAANGQGFVQVGYLKNVSPNLVYKPKRITNVQSLPSARLAQNPSYVPFLVIVQLSVLITFYC